MQLWYESEQKQKNIGKSRSAATEEKIEREWTSLENNTKLIVPRNEFNTRNELKWHPDQINVGHQLTKSNFPERLDFAHWFIRTCQNNKFLSI